MMAGTFILSLDCEGKWGMADHLTAEHHRCLTSSQLRGAYQRLLALFARYDIPVTFAFVMAFLLSAREQRDEDHLFQDFPIAGRNWLEAFRAAQAEGNMEGWSLPELREMVGERPEHEIGCHGFSHLPLAEADTPEQVADAELKAAAFVAEKRNVTIETLVFPRNQVGHLGLLKRHGYRGYRERLSESRGIRGKIGSVASEFDLGTLPQHEMGAAPDAVRRIPSGYFFNWRHGARRIVPPSITYHRWHKLLDRTTAGGVAHLWLHPHNIITAPATLPVLERVLKKVAALRDQGRIETVTQAQYCARPPA
jgi:peptidoglycan/xylan/chitin deacetylase (PgdA/CDA1 family)